LAATCCEGVGFVSGAFVSIQYDDDERRWLRAMEHDERACEAERKMDRPPASDPYPAGVACWTCWKRV
jgi:hypothetical protein